MKKYTDLFLFISLLAPALVQAQAPVQNIESIRCLPQDQLTLIRPSRLGPSQIRYGFVGPYHQWSAMTIDVTNQSAPFTEVERAAPQIQPIRIGLKPNNSTGDWTITCTYGGVGAMTNVINEGTMMLTIRAKTCTLDANTSTVSCKN